MENLFLEELPGVAVIVSEVVDRLLSVDLTSIIWGEEDDSTMDGL
jgi:hypothetical protein